MVPTIEKEKPCACGGTIQRFANVVRCSQCGAQAGVGYKGSVCPGGCDPKLTIRIGDLLHCNCCARSWPA